MPKRSMPTYTGTGRTSCYLREKKLQQAATGCFKMTAFFKPRDAAQNHHAMGSTLGPVTSQAPAVDVTDSIAPSLSVHDAICAPGLTVSDLHEPATQTAPPESPTRHSDNPIESTDNSNELTDSPAVTPEEFLSPTSDEEDVPEGESVVQTVKRLKAEAKRYQSFGSLFQLCAIENFITLLDWYKHNPKVKSPVKKASETVARSVGRGKYFARKVRTLHRYIQQFKTLPPTNSGKHHAHPSLLNNERMMQAVRRYLTVLANGEVSVL